MKLFGDFWKRNTKPSVRLCDEFFTEWSHTRNVFAYGKQDGSRHGDSTVGRKIRWWWWRWWRRRWKNRTWNVSPMASVGQLKEQIATNRNYERLQSRIKQRSKYKFYFSTPIAQLFGYFWPAQVVHTALLQQFLMLIIDINKLKYPSIHRSGCVRRRKPPCEFCRRSNLVESIVDV